MGNFFGGGEAQDDEEEDQKELERWRPAGDLQHAQAMKRKKLSSKSSESSDHQSGDQSEIQSVSSSASKVESESSASKDSARDEEKSQKSEGSKEDSIADDGSEADADAEALAKRDDAKRKKRIVVRMEFEPLLSLHEPLEVVMEEPAELFSHGKKAKNAKSERTAIEEALKLSRNMARMAAEWMNDMALDDCILKELAIALGEDIDELRYALQHSKRFTVDEEGIVKRTLFQRIFDCMQSDIETLQEVTDKLPDGTEHEVRVAVKEAPLEELRLKTANDIELVEQVDLEAERALEKEEEKERKAKEKNEKNKMKQRRGKNKEEDEEDEEGSSDEDDDNMNKEAERKALAFRRVQVQRKIEEFLHVYTKGQNLTKINAKGTRYHRRVYVDTSRKALVVQGASGPKFFMFSSMKEVDIETRTTKEGRVETIVICAIEKGGRIIKELMLSFPDQAKANTFVNCVTLFALALRNAPRKA